MADAMSGQWDPNGKVFGGQGDAELAGTIRATVEKMSDKFDPRGIWSAVAAKSLGLHGHIEQRIRQLEDEVVQLRALRNWLPNELPSQVEEALWRRFQWGPR